MGGVRLSGNQEHRFQRRGKTPFKAMETISNLIVAFGMYLENNRQINGLAAFSNDSSDFCVPG